MLTLKNLSITFNSGTPLEQRVLDNFSLQAGPGEFIVLMGSNGAGKSTLFNAISGNIGIQQGSIYLDNQDCTKWPNYKRSKDVSKVLQDSKTATIGNMTIEENMAFALGRGASRSLLPFSTKTRRILFQEQLKVLGMGLENRLWDLVGNLSGGQRQALSLIMATLTPSKVLLLDEHTAALDPKMANLIMELTERIVRQKGLTTLMITHNLSHALQYGDRLMILKDGKVFQELSLTEKQKLTPVDLVNLFEGL